MKVYRGLDELGRLEEGCTATIGNFDGVHLGHQAILRRARQLADAEGVHLVGVTFEPSPVRVLRPKEAPRRLTPLDVKMRLLEEHGLHRLLVLESTRELLGMTGEEFARDVLVGRLGVRHLVEGPTFHFGRQREATPKSLRQLGAELGFGVHLVEPQEVDLQEGTKVTVSSTLIRGQLMAGQVAAARRCLGRAYTLAGEVTPGRGAGKALGYPTANLRLLDAEQLAGRDGVYAGWARLGETLSEAWESNIRHRAAISIGGCETFADGQWQIEAYLPEFAGGSLYGRQMLLSLVERVRDQERFEGVEVLQAAIAKDCRQVETILLREETQ